MTRRQTPLDERQVVHLKNGKLQESILDRSVFKVLHRKNKDILCKLKPGIGYQLVHISEGGQGIASTVNNVEGSPEQVGVLAVPRAVNSLICSGARPLGITLALTLPENVDEQAFRRMMQAIDQACVQENIEVLGGHTQISSGVSRVIAGITAIGIFDRNLPKKPLAGQDIVMTKWAGMSGTWLLEQKYHDAFVKKYNPDIAEAIFKMSGDFSVSMEAKIAANHNACAIFDLSESGVFGGLWEAAAAGNVGLSVELKKIPLKQETVELCDFIDVNPYLLPSLGALLIACDHGEQLVRGLRQEGIAAAVIGSFTSSNDRIIVNDDETRYLEPPRGSAAEFY